MEWSSHGSIFNAEDDEEAAGFQDEEWSPTITHDSDSEDAPRRKLLNGFSPPAQVVAQVMPYKLLKDVWEPLPVQDEANQIIVKAYQEHIFTTLH